MEVWYKKAGIIIVAVVIAGVAAGILLYLRDKRSFYKIFTFCDRTNNNKRLGQGKPYFQLQQEEQNQQLLQEEHNEDQEEQQ